ncbi:hypothetical protein [Acinetobacter calcoaceticus]|uniref:hypothetical protein n=1 Tax=Acinetobacter calcoaceticus TaxID=471 RepID=UPI0005F04C65|nr:hypothetical protein [Acinetobacter calcoaceticus]
MYLPNIYKFLSATFLLLSSTSYAFEINDLKKIIECQSDQETYTNFASEYDENLSALGFKKVNDPEQPFIYLYKTAQPIQLFGIKTHEIALAGQGIVAVFRNANVNQLSKKFDIPQHPDFKTLSFFRGVRTVKTEPATADSFTVYHNLNLSEMTGKSPMTLLGCTYETDREEMEKMLKE